MGNAERILIVDDEPKICQFLEVLLRREGYDVGSVYNAADGLASLAERPATLVITDLKMPGMDGFEFVRQLKDNYPQIPVIMITGYATVDTAVDALRSGVDDYVTKPFDIDELRKVISRTIKGHRVARENKELNRLLAQTTGSAGQGESPQADAAAVIPTAFSASGDSAENDLDRLLKQALTAINDNLDARASSIMIRVGECLELRACEGDRIYDLIGTRLPLGDGVAGYVAREQHAILVKDESARSVLPPSSAKIYESASFICVPILNKGYVLGVINVGEKGDCAPFTEDDLAFVQDLARQIAPVMSSAVALYALQAQCRTAMQSLTSAYEAKAQFLKDHSERVAEYAVKLARACGATVGEMETIRHAAELHDIGKVAIPEKILHKKGKLTSKQQDALRKHPILSEELVSGLEFLASILPIVRHHHERFDGTGYPDGMKGEDIPPLARMLSLADAFEAMTAKRPYREALSAQEAASEILKESGLQFDDKMAKIFIDRVLSLDS